jgi:MFS family permease
MASAEPGPAREPSAPARPGNRYLQALRLPGTLRFSAAAFIGRLQISMFGLGTVLLISSLTGRYGLAGTVSATAAAGFALVSPLFARLADRMGQRAVLRPLVLVFGAATAALIAGAQAHAPDWVLLVSSAVAGAATPQLGSMVRARWSALLGSSDLMHAAYSWESVAEEVTFVTGPVLVTLLATEVQAASGLIVAAGTCVFGSLWLAAQRSTEPVVPVVPVVPVAAPPVSAGRPGRLLPAHGLITLAPVFVFIGALLAAMDLSTVDFATRHGHKPLAGLILGGYACGSAFGGLWYGSKTWRAPLRRRFVLTVALAAVGTATFWAMPGLGALAAVMLVSGLVLSPILITGFTIIEQQARAGRLTEGMAWLTSALAVGTALGSAVAGQVIDSGGARWGYGFAALCGAAALVACVAGLAQLTVPAAGSGSSSSSGPASGPAAGQD